MSNAQRVLYVGGPLDGTFVTKSEPLAPTIEVSPTKERIHPDSREYEEHPNLYHRYNPGSKGIAVYYHGTIRLADVASVLASGYTPF